MTKDSEDLYHTMSPGEELLDLMRDIREELRQIRKYSERQYYQIAEIDSLRTSVADAAKDVTCSIDSLKKELAAKLAPLSYLPKILEHDQDLGKELTKLIDESTFRLAKTLDNISKSLYEP